MYIVALIFVLLSVVWWFYRTHNNQKQLPATLAFFGSCFAYSYVLYITAHSSIYSWILILPRDLAALIIVGIIANNLKSNKSFFITACLVAAFVYYGYTYLPSLLYKIIPQNIQNIFVSSQKLDSEGELLVEVKNKNTIQNLKKQIAELGGTLRPSFEVLDQNETQLDEYFTIDLKENADINKIIELLEKNPDVNSVERNETFSLNLPNQEDNKVFYTQNTFNDPKINEQWAFNALKLSELNQFLQKNKISPKKRAKIAILDTGVDAEHEDLKGNYESTKKSYDKDKQTHGTHCAGIAAAVSNNKIGIASLAPNTNWVKITSIKVLNDQGWGTQEKIIKGIIEAADKGADVISMSLGGASDDKRQKAYDYAIQYARKKGAIIVVAAGNENQNALNSVPASCNGVIVVTAINSKLQKASFSNTIENIKMGIAAPGEDIFSTLPNQNYGAYSGTSMATPYVAGLLGMMKAIEPSLDTEKAYQILNSTGEETKNSVQTGKLIYPMNALKKLKK
jgi:thermitase